MAKKAYAVAATLAVAAVALSGCSSSGSSDNSLDGTPKGTITVLTNRTDRVKDGTYKKYAEAFQKKYPGTTVKFQALDGYDDAMKTRLNGTKYGDVLMIPAQVKPSQFSQFFVPLGKTSDFEKTYQWTQKATFDGKQYGISVGGAANGMIYNKKVFKEAGITTLPKSESEWIDDLKLIKSKTSAIPYYTNYKDGWPLGQANGNIGAITNDVQAQITMAENPAPWTKGTDIYALDSLVFETVKAGLSEPDPLSTDWETSKTDFASGKIAAMSLGSWAVSQMQAAADKVGASKDDIGYMAWPSNKDGKQYAITDGDYSQAISKHSTNKATALAWIKFFTADSGAAENEGMINAVVGAKQPGYVTDLTDAGVTLITPALAPEGKDSLLKDTANEAGIDLFGQVYRQKLIDVARGAADGTKDSYFAQLNDKWAAAVKKLGSK
ncbi:MAG: extracellular solute-binding protein [Actinobacteria bacterium]|nr:extracellular solute-binding protein [Actinomycetota bacterium]